MGKHLKEQKIWHFFIQTCIGLQYLHTRKILHRDIKTINLFLTRDEKIKIGDLGVAKTMKGVNFAHTLVGTPYYLSPELWEEKPYDHKSDIWSLGWVLYELCTLKHPFTGANQAGLILRIVRGKYEPIPSFYSKELSELVSKCLQKDTRKRPSIHDLLQLDSMQKKAKQLGFKIPTKSEVTDQIANQHSEMKTTFMKKKTEVETKPKKAVAKGSDSSKNRQSSKLMDYKSNQPQRKASAKPKSDHEMKVMELENKINDRKKKHSENLDNKNYKINNKNVPCSYLKDPNMAKQKSDGERYIRPSKDKSGDVSNNKYVNKSALAVDVPLPKVPTNQKVIRDGKPNDPANIEIKKPKLPPKTSQQEHRAKPPVTGSTPTSNRVRGNQQSAGPSRAAQMAARKGSGLLNKKSVKNLKSQKKKEIEDVLNLPDFPNQNDSSSDDEVNKSSMNKPAMQLVAEHKARKTSKKIEPVNDSKNKGISNLHNQKMVIPPESDNLLPPTAPIKKSNSAMEKPTSGSNKRNEFKQARMDSSEFDDLLMGGGGSSKSKSTNQSEPQQQVNDDEFESLMGSSTNKNIESNTPSLPVEMGWKVPNQNDSELFEEGKVEQDDTPNGSDTPESIPDDDFSDEEIEDVDAAFNFTDTEFDANNRDDYTLDTHVMNEAARGTLHLISEADEESEQTIMRKRVGFEIMNLENRLKEMEIIQKSKWNLIVQLADEKVAKAWYDFVWKQFNDSDDDFLEASIEEVHNFIAAHGISEVDNMAFELFTLWNKESDIKTVKEELEQVKERQQLMD